MKNALLIDSGSGGLNILSECIKVVPHCNYLMYCDTKNLPYGNKTAQELQEITFKNLEMISKFFKFDIVIFACNTLTSTCIDACREIFREKIFIGTVPSIKPALKKFESSEVLVLATEATIRYNSLLNSTSNLILNSVPNLASQIDENIDDLSQLFPMLQQNLSEYNPKAVVLGCTHYVAIKDLLAKIFPNAEFFDSANGVARRLKSFVSDEVGFQAQIMSSDEAFLPKLCWYFQKILKK